MQQRCDHLDQAARGKRIMSANGSTENGARAAAGANTAIRPPFDPAKGSSPFRDRLKAVMTSGTDVSCSAPARVPALLQLACDAQLPAQKSVVLQVLLETQARGHSKVRKCTPAFASAMLTGHPSRGFARQYRFASNRYRLAQTHKC